MEKKGVSYLFGTVKFSNNVDRQSYLILLVDKNDKYLVKLIEKCKNQYAQQDHKKYILTMVLFISIFFNCYNEKILEKKNGFRKNLDIVINIISEKSDYIRYYFLVFGK